MNVKWRSLVVYVLVFFLKNIENSDESFELCENKYQFVIISVIECLERLSNNQSLYILSLKKLNKTKRKLSFFIYFLFFFITIDLEHPKTLGYFSNIYLIILTSRSMTTFSLIKSRTARCICAVVQFLFSFRFLWGMLNP